MAVLGHKTVVAGRTVLRIIFRELAFACLADAIVADRPHIGANDRPPGSKEALAKAFNPEGMPTMGFLDGDRFHVEFFVSSHCPSQPAGTSAQHAGL
jgi:hypothetical protein